MKQKIKFRRRHFIVIMVLAVVMLSLVYYLSIIPKTEPDLPKPSRFSCSLDNDCSQNETCRREISLVTKDFFGDYKCLNKVGEGDRCETWSNCLSGKCGEGRCLG